MRSKSGKRKTQKGFEKKKIFICKQEKILRRKRRKLNGKCGSHLSHFIIATNKHTKNSVSHVNGNKITITLPENLDFEENFETTASHFNYIRSAVKGNKIIRSIGFHKIKSISPSAALVLASEIDQWKKHAGTRLKADIETWNENIKRILCQMGFFDLLKIQKPNTELHKHDTIFLPFKTGCVDGCEHGGTIARQLRVEIEEVIGHLIHRSSLFEGISEAITNVGHHAYPHAGYFTPKHWWLSASYNNVERELYVIFFDQGIGIPKTLPKSKLFEYMKDFFHAWTDSQKIKAAMEYGRSSTGLEERGKGLQNLLSFARANREGRLTIYSLCGRFSVEFKPGCDAEIGIQRNHDNRTSIGGTLIEWSVRL